MALSRKMLRLDKLLGLMAFLPLASHCAADPEQMTQTKMPPRTPQLRGVRKELDPRRRVDERGLARRNLWFPVYGRNSTPLNPTKLHAVAIESQVSQGTPLNLPPGWREDLLTQEFSSMPVVERSPNSLDSQNNGEKLLLDQGSLLVHRLSPVTINAAGHDVLIKAQAIAYLVSANNELAIYNLSGSRTTGSVTVKWPDSKHIFDVRPGNVLIFSPAKEFGGVKLGKFVTCTQPWLMTADGGTHVYGARFSYLDALDRCSQFQQCLNSKQQSQRTLADKLLKVSAARLVAESSQTSP